MNKPAIFERPRSLAAARRRRRRLQSLCLAAGFLATLAVAHITYDDTEYCYYELWADGSVTGVNYDHRYGTPAGCVLKEWQDAL